MIIIDQNGTRLGVFSKPAALAMANAKGFDILVVAPEARPMVAKLMNYSKFKFEQKKKMKEAKKNQHVIQVKEIQLSPVIQENDILTKLNQSKKFIEKGNKVKITMRLKGRMMAHKDIGEKVIGNFIERLSELAVVDSKLKLEGNTFYTTIMPKIKK
jgi:translation initiation factor IF-3